MAMAARTASGSQDWRSPPEQSNGMLDRSPAWQLARSHSRSGKRPEAADPCHGGFGGGADRSVACFLASSTSQVETIISVIKAAARASVTYQPLVSLRHRRWVHALGWWCARQHQGDEGCKQFSVTSGGCLSECWCLHCVSGESANTDGSQAPAKEVERKCVMNE